MRALNFDKLHSVIAIVFAMGMFAGTATAGVTPFSWSEDFTYTGDDGADLAGNVTGWDWPGEGDSSHTVIHSGDSAKPGHGGGWHVQHDLGKNINPLDLDSGQKYILKGYFKWVNNDIASGEWVRLTAANGGGNGPHASIGHENGDYLYFGGGSDFPGSGKLYVDFQANDLIGLRVEQTRVGTGYGEDTTDGWYNVNGGGWTSIGSTVKGSMNNITRIHIDSVVNAPVNLHFDTLSLRLVPEPSSLVLLGLGSPLLCGRCRRRRS